MAGIKSKFRAFFTKQLVSALFQWGLLFLFFVVTPLAYGEISSGKDRESLLETQAHLDQFAAEIKKQGDEFDDVLERAICNVDNIKSKLKEYGRTGRVLTNTSNQQIIFLGESCIFNLTSYFYNDHALDIMDFGDDLFWGYEEVGKDKLAFYSYNWDEDKKSQLFEIDQDLVVMSMEYVDSGLFIQLEPGYLGECDYGSPEEIKECKQYRDINLEKTCNKKLSGRWFYDFDTKAVKQFDVDEKVLEEFCK